MRRTLLILLVSFWSGIAVQTANVQASASHPVVGTLFSDYKADLPSHESDSEELNDSVLVIPATVTNIPPYFFADRKDFVRVEFEPGSQLHSIGEYAFLGCSSLREIELPPSLEDLGEGAFRETGLREITIPSSVSKLPKGLFAWCGRLRSVSLPDSLLDIGSHAFAYCGALEQIQIPSGVAHIGSNAFSRCVALKSVEIPDAVTELESYAFSDCVSLKTAKLPANDRLLGELIFSGCTSLQKLYAPSPTPPKFDCNSFIFEPDETQLYSTCKLIVPNPRRYRTAPGWFLFKNIKEY